MARPGLRARAVLVALVLAAGPLGAGEAPPPAEKMDPTARIEKALDLRLGALDAQEHTLNEWLQLFGKIANENFILDPGLPQSVGETKLTVRVQQGGTVLDALAVTLALAGLRYAVFDGAVFISTEGKLAERLLTGQSVAEPVSAVRARAPMSVGEAVVRAQPFDPEEDEFIGGADMIASSPWRLWEGPRYNARTGLTDYPGPPIWIEDPGVNSPRFRYATRPSFLKPEYLALEQEKWEAREAQALHERAAREAQARRERAAQDSDARALAALVQLLKNNPDLKAKDILEKLGAGK